MKFVYNLLTSLPLPRTLKNLLLYPPGHFYSPLPSMKEVRAHEERLFAPPPEQLPGIDLNTKAQLELFDKLKLFYPGIPFKAHRERGLRYYYENETFSYSDAIVLYCMIRHLQPKRIVEIGSGYSSCVILDVNEQCFKNSIDCTFIDPFPGQLRSMLKDDDYARITILEKQVQDVDIGIFGKLRAGDILFIDSTHVAKIDSDVNHMLFTILPGLQCGVNIHFHDIMYPFEYPREWIYGGRAWNEAYMLRAFLQHNSAFTITFFNTYLEHFYEERFRNEMPLCLKNRGGSIWLTKT